MILKRIVIVMAIMLIAAPVMGMDSEMPVGFIVAIRGEVALDRASSTEDATLNAEIFANDRVETGEDGRAKIRFLDDSTVTMSPESILDISEYLESLEGEKGKSLLKMTFGKMRVVSGKNKLEVHTPTAVAATRGTEFFVIVSRVSGKVVTEIPCLEGALVVRNIDSDVEGEVVVNAGQVTRIGEMEKPTEPASISRRRLKDFIECRKAIMERMEN
ncbi:hypothetical protein EP232_04265 [bacterium]|nr:MAG: hypothetical protein EP232_04265 [bacterium]